MNYKLRPYQDDVITNVLKSLKTNNRVLIVAPCGSGKTVIAAKIVSENAKLNRQVWFIVHRKELVDQAVETFENAGIPMENIHVFMVQSLKNRLKTMTDTPDIIIIDEAHHCTSKSYLTILETFPLTRVIGLTATPTRLSGKPLGDVFQDMITSITANELIKLGYLANYEYYAPKVDINFSEAKIVAGDYKSSDIDVLMNTPKIFGDILANYKKLAHERKTIIYCPSVDYSKKIEVLFKANGYSCAHFDGDTPKEERDNIIKKFREGTIQILINVDLIGEGFDVPACDCVVLLRPTQSLGLYIQQSTRCLRPDGAKIALIIDMVANVYRHGMPTDDREWSLTESMSCDNKVGEPDIKVRQCTKCYKCYKGTDRICPYCWHDNGKTRREIQNEEKLELERITEMTKKNNKLEKSRARTKEDLIAYGKSRGFKNPEYWAMIIMKSRGSR